MLILDSVTQPRGRSNLELLAETLNAAQFDQIDVAAAYVTTGGARDVLKMLESSLGTRWGHVRKRWVVALDYCRTEPLAMRMLSNAPRSSLRIHDGVRVLRQACNPKTPFHPKTFIFRGTGQHVVFAGSGNLSRSGLNTGNEVGLLLGYQPPTRQQDVSAATQVQRVQDWYEDIWTAADRADEALFASYERIYDSTKNRRDPVPTDDDVVELRGKGSLTPEELRKLRVCTHFWIEAGNVTRNLGPYSPGNQLMMKRLSRVFFGVPAADVPQNSPLTRVSIEYQRVVKVDCSLTFSDNGMDKLTLPIPGAGGPPSYDQQTLLFTRLSAGSFRLDIGTPAQIRDWIRRSRLIDGAYTMQGGRQWGVF